MVVELGHIVPINVYSVHYDVKTSVHDLCILYI